MYFECFIFLHLYNVHGYYATYNFPANIPEGQKINQYVYSRNVRGNGKG